MAAPLGGTLARCWCVDLTEDQVEDHLEGHVRRIFAPLGAWRRLMITDALNIRDLWQSARGRHRKFWRQNWDHIAKGLRTDAKIHAALSECVQLGVRCGLALDQMLAVPLTQVDAFAVYESSALSSRAHWALELCRFLLWLESQFDLATAWAVADYRQARQIAFASLDAVGWDAFTEADDRWDADAIRKLVPFSTVREWALRGEWPQRS